MNRYLYTFFFILSAGFLFGQKVSSSFNDTLLRKEKLLNLLSNSSLDDQQDIFLKARLELSDIYISQNNPAQALRHLLEAKIGLDGSHKSEIQIDILSRLGQIYFDQKIYEDALIYFDEISLLENGSNERIEGLKGACYAALKQTDKAYSSFNKLYEKSRIENRIKDQLRYLQQLVDLYYNAKDYEKALSFNYRLEKLINQHSVLNEQYIIVNNLGYNYTFLKKYENAIEQFNKSLSLIPKDQINEKVNILINLAICQNNLGNIAAATLYYNKALSIIDVSSQAFSVAQINHLIATTYYKDKDYFSAFRYLEKAIEIAKKKGFSSLLSESYYTAATIRVEQNKFKEALGYFEEYLSIRDSLAFKVAIEEHRFVQEKIVLERTEKELELARIDKALKKSEIDKLNLENNNLKLAKETLELNALKNRQQLELASQQRTIQNEQIKNQELEFTKERQRLVIATKEKFEAQQEIELLRLNSVKENQEIELLEMDKVITKERQEAELLKKQSEIDQLEIVSQKQFRKNSIIIGILATGLLILLLAGVFYMRYSNRKLNSQNQEIELQRKKIEAEKELSDRLLHNILPVSVADELKSKGVVTPKRYEKVTVLFTDFSEFTRLSSILSPEELIQDMEECFLAFDNIIEKYNIEKIKTIGDSYMCAGGIPEVNDNSPIDCVLAALEFQEYLEKLYIEKTAAGKEYWRMRVGIHTGPLVAGVIGNKKFSYDIWGDTVNIASRLEAHGEIGKVNISQYTYQFVKEKVKCSYRGEIEVKHRGSLKMYFVDEII